MTRPRKLIFAVLNIKFADRKRQKATNYLELLKDIQAFGLVGHGYSKQAMLIGTLASIFENDNGEKGIYGFIYKYFNLPADTRWIDTSTMKPIMSDKGIVPPNIKPEYKSLGYVFFPQKHRLVFDCSNIGVKYMYKAISQICSYVPIHEIHGDIDVCIESSKEAVEELIKLPNKRSVDIKITIPNDDELFGMQAELFDDMRIRNVNTYEQHSASRHPDGLVLSQRDEAYIRISASNGKTIIKNIEGGNRIERSTENYPLLYPKQYYEKDQMYISTVQDAAQEIIQEL